MTSVFIQPMRRARGCVFCPSCCYQANILFFLRASTPLSVSNIHTCLMKHELLNDTFLRARSSFRMLANFRTVTASVTLLSTFMWRSDILRIRSLVISMLLPTFSEDLHLRTVVSTCAPGIVKMVIVSEDSAVSRRPKFNV